MPATTSIGEPRLDADRLTERLLASADTLAGPRVGSLDSVREWLAAAAAAEDTAIRRIPLAGLDEWEFREGTGDLAHRSGAFFKIRGLRVDGAPGPIPSWGQPIIDQREIGVLGILVKEIDGVLCLLMQAKMEPGNINRIQLSPTVQATRSNYRRVHGGSATRYLDLFTDPAGRGRVLVDVLQSEQCSSFYQKRNRNMIIEMEGDVPESPAHRWVTLGQVLALLRENNAVNMNTRSVLSNLPLTPGPLRRRAAADPFAAALLGSLADRADTIGVLTWFNRVKSSSDLRADTVPLDRLDDWTRGEYEIRHRENRYFSVLAVSVGDAAREVRSWRQPLIAPRGRGVVAFLACRSRGVLEVLVRARVEAGTRDIAELGPTVQAVPANYAGRPDAHRPRYLDAVNSAPAEALRFDALQSEEGGRFFHAEHRYAVVEVGEDVRGAPVPPDYRWCTVGSLAGLLCHSGYFNVEARSLLTCLHSLW